MTAGAVTRYNRTGLLAGQPVGGETGLHIRVCNEYLTLPPGGRTMPRVLDACRKLERAGLISSVPSISALYNWSKKYEWERRAALLDQRVEQERAEAALHEINSGLALPENRVAALKELFQRVEGVIEDYGLMFDTKITEGGDTKVRHVKYNSSAIDNLRGILDDIAKETGGRVKRSHTQHTITGLSDMLSNREAAEQVEVEVWPSEPEKKEISQ